MFHGEAQTTRLHEAKPFPEDGQRVKPKQRDGNDPSCKPCTPITNKWDQNVVFLRLPGVACTLPPTIHLFLPWFVCVFVKQWILLCFSEN